MNDERRARMGLTWVTEAGDPDVAAAVVRQGAVEVWQAVVSAAYGSAMAERASRVDLDLVERQSVSGRFRFVIPGDEEWPAQLGDLEYCGLVQRRGGMPHGLWLRGPGRLDQLVASSVAIVGSRAATSYGETVAADLAVDLGDRGVCVVSGGAFGIDAAAHRGALAGGGATVAVLACGVDVSYPPGNRGLFEEIGRSHLIVSELPPGAHPTRVRFLARNRIIAALTQGTVVVEAAVRSGARNTATWAQECSRPLMAVPGPVHSALSVAPHLLIRDQRATLVTSAAEVVEMISPVGQGLAAPPPPTQGGPRPADGLDAVRLAVFEAVPAGGRRTSGEIALAAGLSVPDCLAELDSLEDCGLVEGDERGWRISRSVRAP